MVVINIHPSFNNSLFYTFQWIKQIANEPTSDINFIVLLMEKQFNDFIHSNHLYQLLTSDTVFQEKK